MTDNLIDVAIIGAGPYGLSLGAHLQARGIEYCVFGDPMKTWLAAMPTGMHLKSEGFASNLSDPTDEFSLKNYCANENIDYADIGRPVEIETFIAYGLEFQRRYVKTVDQRLVADIQQSSEGFVLTLDDASTVVAHRVILAVGITYFAYVPPVFSALPLELCSHSSHHTALDKFAGQHVAVIGAGSSALDLAALLRRVDSDVELIARKQSLSFHQAMQVPRRLHQRVLAPTSGLGPGWRSRFYTDAAPLFHRLPEKIRMAAVRNSFGPTGGWFIRDEIVNKITMSLGTQVQQARQEGNRVLLELENSDESTRKVVYDHVIVATGYRTHLGRVDILHNELRDKVATTFQTPVLSGYFESSIPGLYFIGPMAASSFGPMMRFAYGSRFVARRLARHLA